MSAPNRKYVSGDFTDAVPVSAAVKSAPFDGVETEYILVQDFQIDEDFFAPLALDTPHPDEPDFKLAREDNKRSLGGGMIQWTRTYIKLPDEYEEERGNYSYSFIGISGLVPGVGFVGFDNGTPSGRVRPPAENVPLFVTRTFFNTADPSTILVVSPQEYYYNDPYSRQDYVWDDNAQYTETTPNRTDYLAAVAAETKIVVEPSVTTRWMGNFWIRETYKVVAK